MVLLSHMTVLLSLTLSPMKQFFPITLILMSQLLPILVPEPITQSANLLRLDMKAKIEVLVAQLIRVSFTQF